MATAQQSYSAAILRACEDHLTRVNSARSARMSLVSKAKIFTEHDPSNSMARITAYAAAKEQYEKAIRSSEKRRLQDEANAMAALRETDGVTLGRAQCHLSPTHLQTGRKDATVPDASSSSIRLPRRSGRLGLYLNPYTDAAWDQGEFSLT